MIVAMIQARMGSSRLPGKIMMLLNDKPVLSHITDRLKKSNCTDETIIITSVNGENDVVREFAYKENIECFSGSENDVLRRYVDAAEKFNLNDDDHIIRITADCPLINPSVIDDLVKLHLQNESDYSSNTLIRSYPDGLDCEIVKVKILREINDLPLDSSEREHVTLNIVNHKDEFNTSNLEFKTNLSSLRWTLDTLNDYQFLNRLFSECQEEELDDIESIISCCEAMGIVNEEK